jgi:hypothetical protein
LQAVWADVEAKKQKDLHNSEILMQITTIEDKLIRAITDKINGNSTYFDQYTSEITELRTQLIK